MSNCKSCVRSRRNLTKKKNVDLNNSQANPKTLEKVTALPVVSIPTKQDKSSPDLLDRFVNLAAQQQQEPPSTAQSAVENTLENETDNEETETIDHLSAETYRWEWINPEMAQEESGIRPSDIKQAILQEKTPEVVEKVIRLAEEQDEWTRTVGQLALENLKLIKQIALNSVLLSQSENEIRLGLRSAQSHLNKENAVAVLQQALSTHYQKPMQLTIEINDDETLLTPLDQRRNVYQQLSEQAREDLMQDKQIQLLQKAFDAKLDMSSIRPV